MSRYIDSTKVSLATNKYYELWLQLIQTDDTAGAIDPIVFCSAGKHIRHSQMTRRPFVGSMLGKGRPAVKFHFQFI